MVHGPDAAVPVWPELVNEGSLPTWPDITPKLTWPELTTKPTVGLTEEETQRVSIRLAQTEFLRKFEEEALLAEQDWTPRLGHTLAPQLLKAASDSMHALEQGQGTANTWMLSRALLPLTSTAHNRAGGACTTTTTTTTSPVSTPARTSPVVARRASCDARSGSSDSGAACSGTAPDGNPSASMALPAIAPSPDASPDASAASTNRDSHRAQLPHPRIPPSSRPSSSTSSMWTESEGKAEQGCSSIGKAGHINSEPPPPVEHARVRRDLDSVIYQRRLTKPLSDALPHCRHCLEFTMLYAECGGLCLFCHLCVPSELLSASLEGDPGSKRA